jgi:hypothetical protein
MHGFITHAVRLSRGLRAAALSAVLSAALAACGSAGTSASSSTSSGMSGMSGMGSSATASAPASMGAMSAMDEPMYTGDGLSVTSSGFTLVPASGSGSLPSGQAVALKFRIADASGMALTSYQDDQTKLMHFYVVRSDLAGFQHVHPTMAADGTWTANLAAMTPGTYRMYASFITKGSGGTAVALVLSRQFTVAGMALTTALPAVSTSAQVDGYTVTLSGELMAGMEHTLTATVTKNGAPVTDLQPYLDTYAHLTAFHEGDLAFAHLHPQGTVSGDHGGPTLTFAAQMAKTGDYRLFLQFQTGGVLHTAAITLHVA